MSPEILIPMILFFAFLTQSTIGFGSALIAIPFIAPILNLRYATPMFVIVAFIVEVFLIWIYLKSFRFQEIWRIALMCMIGIPIGVGLVRIVESDFLLTLLGIFVIGYVIYAFLTPILPKVRDLRWGYLVGIIAGVLSGAYSTAGPPFVIYGTASEWTPSQFKANLNTLFTLSSVVALVTHFVSGNFTAEVIRFSALALPAAIIAVFVGTWLSPKIPTERFRQIVLIVLLLSGIRLLLS